MSQRYYTSGQVAEQIGMPRWRLLYLLERGDLPGPSVQVPGRRLFTEADLECIMKTLANQPQLEGDATDCSRPLKRDK